MNYVYQDQVLLPVAVTAPAGARPGETSTLQAAGGPSWCAPRSACPRTRSLSLTLPVTQGPAPPDPRWSAAIAKAAARGAAPGRAAGRLRP